MQLSTSVNQPPPSGNVSHAISDRHKSASRMLGYALTVNLPSVWVRSAIVWEARLTPQERCELARSVLMAMRPDEIRDLVSGMLEGVGSPLPPFGDVLDDAQWWSANATAEELRAYCLIAFKALSPDEQAQFVDHVKVAA